MGRITKYHCDNCKKEFGDDNELIRITFSTAYREKIGGIKIKIDEPYINRMCSEIEVCADCLEYIVGSNNVNLVWHKEY